jgi:hypothetical protein
MPSGHNALSERQLFMLFKMKMILIHQTERSFIHSYESVMLNHHNSTIISNRGCYKYCQRNTPYILYIHIKVKVKLSP